MTELTDSRRRVRQLSGTSHGGPSLLQSPFGASKTEASIQRKLRAAMVLRGVVRLTLMGGSVEVEAATSYREDGERWVDARRRDSGERLRIPYGDILDVTPY